MTEHKFVVMYPLPSDVVAFEKVYSDEHVPMAVKNFKGKSKIVATTARGSFPDGSKSQFYKIVEVYFPNKEALDACLASSEARDTFAHGGKISSGGKPLIFIAESETFNF
jgi:uncharacterized protein (TIGR02118 family)